MNLLQAFYRLGLDFDKRLSCSEKLPVPVLSVGNISVGGRAKTPLVIDLCKKLKGLGFLPVVLTRGYGRRYAKNFWMLPEGIVDASTLNADLCGDEALEIFLMAKVPVLVSANRGRNAKAFLKSHRLTELEKKKLIFVLDDGFQHWKLKRDFDLVVVSDVDFRDTLLPTGRLRESIAALDRADHVLHLSKDLLKEVKIKNVESVSSLASLAISTRAGNQSAYQEQLSQYLNFKIEVLSFKDHLDRLLLEKELIALPSSVKQLLLGYKEAVKLLTPETLLSTKSPVMLNLRGRSFEVFLVELVLNYDRELLLSKLKQKGVLA